MGGIHNKQQQLKQHFIEHDINIAGVPETKLNRKTLPPPFLIQTRPAHRGEGGLLTYMQKDIPFI